MHFTKFQTETDIIRKVLLNVRHAWQNLQKHTANQKSLIVTDILFMALSALYEY